MKIHPTKLTGFHGVTWIFIGHSTSAFFCSLSEAQKGAEDKMQIKAQLGGLPVTRNNEEGQKNIFQAKLGPLKDEYFGLVEN